MILHDEEKCGKGFFLPGAKSLMMKLQREGKSRNQGTTTSTFPAQVGEKDKIAFSLEAGGGEGAAVKVILCTQEEVGDRGGP